MLLILMPDLRKNSPFLKNLIELLFELNVFCHHFAIFTFGAVEVNSFNNLFNLIQSFYLAISTVLHVLLSLLVE